MRLAPPPDRHPREGGDPSPSPDAAPLVAPDCDPGPNPDQFGLVRTPGDGPRISAPLRPG